MPMKYILIPDPDKCTGCRICEMGCSMIKTRRANPGFSRIRVVKIEEKGVDYPLACLHCEDPPCMKSCPTDAIIKEETGAVVIGEKACIGCKMCFLACPFGAISINDNMPVKCDLCGGNPFCARVCPTDAISYVDESVRSSKKRLEFVESIISRFGVIE